MALHPGEPLALENQFSTMYGRRAACFSERPNTHSYRANGTLPTCAWRYCTPHTRALPHGAQPDSSRNFVEASLPECDVAPVDIQPHWKSDPTEPTAAHYSNRAPPRRPAAHPHALPTNTPRCFRISRVLPAPRVLCPRASRRL